MKRFLAFLLCVALLCGGFALSEDATVLVEPEGMVIEGEACDRPQPEVKASGLDGEAPEEGIPEQPAFMIGMSDETDVEPTMSVYADVTEPSLGEVVFAPESEAAGGVYINELSFPDAAFRRYLRERVEGGEDGYLSSAEIAKIKVMDLDCTDENHHVLTDMTGIEHFKALEELEAGSSVREIDMRGNPKLKSLRCDSYAHDLVKVNVSGCAELESLYISSSRITELDLSGCPKLKTLNLSSCFELSRIDLSHNPLLESVTIGSYFDDGGRYPMSSIDLSRNINLVSLSLKCQAITQLDLSRNTKLRTLDCTNTMLQTLDVSANKQLEGLAVSKSMFLKELKLGSKPSLFGLHMQEVPLLKRVDISGCPYIIKCYEEPSDYWSNVANGEYVTWIYIDDSPSQTPIQLYITPGMEIGPGDTPATEDKEKLAVVEENLTIGKGEKLKLLTKNNSYTADKCTFMSSDKEIVSVTNKGQITGKNTGTATITINSKDGNASATCKVTVKPAPLSVEGIPKTTTLAVGETLQLTPAFKNKDDEAVSYTITWKSSKKTVATVDNGLVKALKAGKAKITVTTFNGKKATCEVTVEGSTNKRDIYILCLGGAINTTNDVDLMYSRLIKNKLEGCKIKRKTKKALKKNWPGEAKKWNEMDYPTKKFYDTWVQKAFKGSKKNDLCIAYLHGHGEGGGEKGGRGLALVKRENNENVEYPYSYKDFLEMLTHATPGQVILLVDACYSGGFVETAENEDVYGKDRLHIITSSAINQKSFNVADLGAALIIGLDNRLNLNLLEEDDAGIGIYTGALAEGLNGLYYSNADKEGDGVSVSELYTYIKSHIIPLLREGKLQLQKIQVYPENDDLIIYQR